MLQHQNIESEFISLFGSRPHGMVKAPGRICLLGEHSDYNQGFVLPFALDLTTIVTFKVRDNPRVRVRSLKYPDYEDSFDLAGEVTHCVHGWANYVRGVFYIIRDYGFELRRGLDLLISSTLPLDAGLASSGAMSAAVAGAVRKALNLPLDKRSLALVAEKAENEFFGRGCGIMDPLTATLGREGNLLLIDCEDYSVKYVPFPDQYAVVVFNSRARKELIGNEFNNLRNTCQKAAQTLNVGSLRHATQETLSRHKDEMDNITQRCAYHIITENERTRDLADAFMKADFRHACRLMNESYDSSKLNFGNTIEQTDSLVDFCREELGGNVGARMTGGGFGGSVIALCKRQDANMLARNVGLKYFNRFGFHPPTHICRPADGMRIRWN